MDKLNKPEAACPLNLPHSHYEIRGNYVFDHADDEDFHSLGKKVCGLIKFTGYQTKLDSDRVEVGIVFWDITGKLKQANVARSEFRDATKLVTKLLDLGLEVFHFDDTKEILESLYEHFPPTKTITSTLVPGWNWIDDPDPYDVYVIENRTYQPGGRECNLVLASGVETGISASGDLAKWNKKVGELLIGNSWLQFAICAPIAGILHRFAGLPIFAIQIIEWVMASAHLAVEVGASVLGPQSSALLWEPNDSVLLISTAPAAGASRRAKGGRGSTVDVPALTISIDLPRDVSIIQDIHGHTDAAAFAAALTDGMERNYGVVGDAIIKFAVENQDRLWETLPLDIMVMRSWLQEQEGVSIGNTPDVVINSFALIAVGGEVVIEQQLIKWPRGAAKNAVKECFIAWLRDQVTTAPVTDDVILRRIKKFFQSDRGNKFAPFSEFEADTKGTRAGYIHQVDGRDVFLVLPAFFEQLFCEKFGRNAVVMALTKLGLIILGARGGPTRQVSIPKHLINGGAKKVSFYVISMSILRA